MKIPQSSIWYILPLAWACGAPLWVGGIATRLFTQLYRALLKGSLFCLCILHQSCLTITSGTANCPLFGGLGSRLHLLWRELGSLTCLRVTLPRIWNLAWFELLFSQTRSLASIMLDFSCGALQRWLYELVKYNYTIPVRRSHKLSQPFSY